MAVDDNEVRHEASDLAGVPKPSEPLTDGAKAVEEPVGSSPSTMSEWTASDTRGALNEVGAIPVAGEGYAGAAFHEEPIHDHSKSASHVADEHAAPHVSTVIPDAMVTSRKSSLWPVAAGIVIGAAIGAGSAYYVYTATGVDSSVTQQLAALSGRVDALDKRPAPDQAIAPLKASLADLASKVNAVEALAKSKSVAAPGAPQAAGTAASQPSTAPNADVTGLQQKVEALRTALGTLQQQAASSSDLKAAESKLAVVETSVTDVQKQSAATQGDVQSLKSGQKSLEGKITNAPALAVVADSLVEQINRGLPFASQVSALESLGVDPAKTAVLRQSADQGVPSAAVLAAKFEPLTDLLLSTGSKAKPNASFWERMKDGAAGLVSIRRVDDVDGTDTPSRVNRIKADLTRNDVIDAVATWNLLPPEVTAKQDAAAWGALAKTSADAKTAANAVEHDAIAALGAKKS